MRLKLPQDRFEFVFVDGPCPCPAAPGTDILFESRRHYSYWTDPAAPPETIKSSTHWLDAQIQERGPFDILMGFSQGCSLISSYIIYHSLAAGSSSSNSSAKPLPFKAAIFVCGGVPLQVLEDVGFAVSQRAKAINHETGKLLRQRTSTLAELAANPALIKEERGVPLWDRRDFSTGMCHDARKIPDVTDVFGLDLSDANVPEGVRIQIPTVHVYGAKDPRWPASLQLAFLCRNRKTYDHGGGHDIPRTTEVSEKMAGLVMELLKEIGEE